MASRARWLGWSAARCVVSNAAAAWPLVPSPLSQLDGELDGQRFGRRVASGGDVDGDGFDDVLVSDFAPTTPRIGRVRLYRGGPGGLDPTPAWEALGSAPDDGFGSSLVIDGDLDGDGFDDVVVGSSAFTNGEFQEGRVQAWRGSASGPPADPSWSWEPDVIAGELAVAAHAGDVNADGFADVLVLVPRDGACCFNEPSAVHAFLGSAAGLPPAPSWTRTFECGFDSEMPLGDVLGDVNGDGFDDIALVAPTGTQPWCFRSHVLEVIGGSAAGPAAAPLQVLVPPEGLSAVARGGDANGDGFADALVGYTFECCDYQGWGLVQLLAGTAAGLSATPLAVIRDPTDGACSDFTGVLGRYMASVADADGDGDDEIALGAPWGGHRETAFGCTSLFVGHVQVHAGRPGGPAAGWDLRVLGTTPGEPPNWAGDPSWNSDFGHVARAGDVNGDGQGDLVVSSPGENGVGRVLLLIGQPDCPITPAHLVASRVAAATSVRLAWSDAPGVLVHAVHVGTLGALRRGAYDHVQRGCFQTSATIASAAAAEYYLVAAAQCVGRPTFGADSTGRPRPGDLAACP